MSPRSSVLSSNVYRQWPSGFTRSVNVVWKGSLQLDAYKPSQAGRPIAILVHGGSWSGGDKTQAYASGTAEILATAGFCVFNVNYTLTVDNNVDTSYRDTVIQDIRDAVTWARANAAPYNGDASRVCLFGFSAGAHLCLLASFKGAVGADRPEALVCWAPVALLLTLPNTGSPSLQHVASNFMGCAMTGGSTACDVASAAYSPTNLITSQNCPPLRIVGSSNENPSSSQGLPQSQYDGLYAAAVAAGVPGVIEVIYNDTIHADMRGRDMAATIDWVLRVLKPTSSPTPRSTVAHASTGARVQVP